MLRHNGCYAAVQVSSHKATADAALGALQVELRNTHAALQGAQLERRHEARKTTAAMLLTRLEVGVRRGLPATTWLLQDTCP